MIKATLTTGCQQDMRNVVAAHQVSLQPLIKYLCGFNGSVFNRFFVGLEEGGRVAEKTKGNKIMTFHYTTEN